MKRGLVLAAAGVVVAANVWALVSAWRNRSDAPGGTIELTERELPLPSLSGESTAIFLELEWDSLSVTPDQPWTPRWLDAAKLAELGFDCRLPVTHPEAREHYRSLPPRLVYVALEYAGETWQQAGSERKRKTRLFAVDAGLDPRRLRQQHADAARYVITRASVGVSFRERGNSAGESLAEPRLEGRLDTLVPNQLFVPRPHNRALEGLRRRDAPAHGEAENEPRYTVTVSWGKNYEPWVCSIRRK